MAAPSTGAVRVVGSANLDIVATVARIPRPGETLLGRSYQEFAGGKGLNQAIAAARSGASVGFTGAVGDDAAGATLRSTLAEAGVDTADLAVAEAPTGRAVIYVDDAGENVIVVVPGANAQVAPPTTIGAAAVVLTQLEVPVSTVTAALAAGRRVGAVTILNPAPAAELPDATVASCDIIVPNEHEVALLGGVEHLLARGVETVIVTRGGDGVDVHTQAGSWHQPACEVDVVDTTGAGDAFCGALAARLAVGAELAVAVRWAAAAGALATTRHGAVPAQPHASDIDRLLTTTT